jgi:hypothetical protein
VVRTQYQNKELKQLSAFENLNENEDINRAWRNIKENIKTSAEKSLCLSELKKHKPDLMEDIYDF